MPMSNSEARKRHQTGTADAALDESALRAQIAAEIREQRATKVEITGGMIRTRAGLAEFEKRVHNDAIEDAARIAEGRHRGN